MFTIDQKVSTIERWRLFGALSPHACAGAKHAKANVADSAIAFKFFLLKFIVIVYKYSVFLRSLETVSWNAQNYKKYSFILIKISDLFV